MSINEISSNRLPRLVTRRREQRERGRAVILTALMMVFTIPIVGLAIDAGLLYVVRGRLSAACDAASLATARNLNLGLTLSQQTAAATARGTAFFNANFPPGYMGTSGITPSIVIAQVNLSTLGVTTTASGNAPLYFMRYMGNSVTMAGAVGKASRRDVNMILVLDRSGSMWGQPCADMITASKTFVNLFVNQRDTLGLITFGGAVYRAYPPSKNFKSSGSLITDSIDQISCGNWTNTPQSYWNAYQELVTINQPLALNLIVFFTDGVPTAFSDTFPVKTVSDTRYGFNGASCNQYSTCTVSKSTCDDDLGKTYNQSGWGTFAPKSGVFTGGDLSSSNGDTYALVDPVATSFDTSDPQKSSGMNNCRMNTSSDAARQDLAYASNPAPYLNGSLSLNGYYSLATLPSGPYSGKIRIDTPINISRIAWNLADNAATTIRSNTNLNVITYTIGLDGNGGVDDVLLKRMANDVASSNYDSTKDYGLYVYAPNSSDLNNAFARIASAILRLAQ